MAVNNEQMSKWRLGIAPGVLAALRITDYAREYTGLRITHDA